MRGATSKQAGGGRARDVISIHAPHARSDRRRCGASSMRSNFNPRSSCEERQSQQRKQARLDLFQSTLLMRGATLMSGDGRKASEFQSTLLMRGATIAIPRSCFAIAISIHAPHARSDHTRLVRTARMTHFNPRSSCEERLFLYSTASLSLSFQSTLLMRGATETAKGIITGA